ncbi:MAG: LysR family transcriptional regulator [Pseudomonadota bacterium]
MSDHFRWDDLRVFLAIARAGQVSGAGRALGMDAATVGRRITLLEGQLGARLFDRSQKGFRLTDAGRRLVEPAEAMERAALALRRPEEPAEKGLSGTVRIGAPEGVASFILSTALTKLAEKHPNLKLELAALPRAFSLSQREADLAITVSAPQAGRLKVRRIADYTLHLYAVPEIAERIRGPEDLRKERMLGYVSDMIFDPALDYLPLLDLGLSPQLSSTSVHVQQLWCNFGYGLCVLHDFAVPPDGRLVKVLPDQISFLRSFYLVRHADDLGLPRIDEVAEALVREVRLALP